jgi:hypothetical protein
MPIVELFLSIIGGIRFVWPIFKGVGLITFSGILILCYWLFKSYFINSGLHGEIIERYKDETLGQRRKSKMVLSAYYLLSATFFFSMLYLRHKIRGY